MAIVALPVLCWLSTPDALAGPEPWVLGRDDRSVYVGVDATRWSRFAGPEGSFGAEPLPFGTAVTRTAVVASVSYGLLAGVAVDVDAGVAYSAVAREDAPICTDLGPGGCDDVLGVTPVVGRVAWRVLDEFTGRPLTVTLGPTVRFGDPTRPYRDRITQIGEGQTDLGGYVSIGRTAGLGGSASLAAFVQAEYRHRLGLATVAGHKAPGDELAGIAEVLVSPNRGAALGARVDALERPWGAGFGEVDDAGVDRFTALRVTAVKAGPKLVLRSLDHVSLALTALFTVYAIDNPTDGWTLSVGVGGFRPSRSGASGGAR